MLPLAGAQLPDSAESLAQALRDGLAAHGLAAREVSASGAWPALDALRLDLTGLRLTRTQRLPAAKTPMEGSVETAEFQLTGAPVQIEQTPVTISLRAQQAAFGFAHSAEGELLLVLTRAVHGDLMIEATREALETQLQALAAEAAGKQGIEIKKTALEVTSRGPRELSFRADVTAKVFIATAKLALSGDLDVDDQLTARLSNLRFSGDGMIANAAGSFIRPRLAALEGRAFPLMAFPLGEIKLRDLQLQGGESLRLTAQFGS